MQINTRFYPGFIIIGCTAPCLQGQSRILINKITCVIKLTRYYHIGRVRSDIQQTARNVG
jgi:hypothetical protein